MVTGILAKKQAHYPQHMTAVTIVKLGGSAITDKSRECTPDISTINESAHQLAKYRKPLIILHGAGSYGHPIVAKAKLQEGFRERSQLRAIAETELCLGQLTRMVEVALLRRNMSFAPLRPMSFLTMKNGRIDELFIEPLNRALKIGLIPLIHGDLAFDSTRGVSVISADQLASHLGLALNGARVLFGCDVDGVFMDRPSPNKPRLIKTVDRPNARQVVWNLKSSSSEDATGGMYNKVTEALKLARHGRRCYIFNLKKEGFLAKALSGTLSVGTFFRPWASEP
jgi:isopentenyl phosphate kinase